jgi:hypothetical protein
MSRPAEFQNLLDVQLGIPFKVSPNLKKIVQRYENGNLMLAPIGLEVQNLGSGSMVIFKRNVLHPDVPTSLANLPAGSFNLEIVEDQKGRASLKEETMPLGIHIRLENQALSVAKRVAASVLLGGAWRIGVANIDPDEFKDKGQSGQLDFNRWLSQLEIAQHKYVGLSLFPQTPLLFDRLQFMLHLKNTD